MSPKTVLSITGTIYDQTPEAILVSVRGFHFEFERELSQKTAALAEEATNRIWNWLIAEH
jgi:Ni,Fe-hydrogenase maturation factor